MYENNRFAIGDRVAKKTGSSWQGRVVGYYSTKLTPNGVCVESELEVGSVQIYPEAALGMFDAVHRVRAETSSTTTCTTNPMTGRTTCRPSGPTRVYKPNTPMLERTWLNAEIQSTMRTRKKPP